jgi:hypothetical protein
MKSSSSSTVPVSQNFLPTVDSIVARHSRLNRQEKPVVPKPAPLLAAKRKVDGVKK